VYSIYKDNHGIMWFGTSNFGVCRYDGKSHSWLYEDHLTNTPQGGSFGIRSILQDSKGEFWFCNTRYRYAISPDVIKDQGKSLIKYNREIGINARDFSNMNLPFYFMSILEDDQGNIWMATYDEGVWKYDGKSMRKYIIKDGEEVVTLFSISQDRSGALWLGTHKNGAYKFNGEAFEKYVF
jgi:ligand-binding sensor domain-containing protein